MNTSDWLLVAAAFMSGITLGVGIAIAVYLHEMERAR